MLKVAFIIIEHFAPRLTTIDYYDFIIVSRLQNIHRPCRNENCPRRLQRSNKQISESSSGHDSFDWWKGWWQRV